MTRPRDQGGAGVRPTRRTNLAMLAKGGWKLASNDNTLWAQVLRGKYGKERTGPSILKRIKGSSFSWQSFYHAADIVRKNCAMNVSNGRRTKFWTDCWVLQVPLINLAVAEIPMEIREWRVIDLWDPDQGWKVTEFEHLLPQATVDSIRSVLVDPMSTEDDTLIWKESSNGTFTTKSPYKSMDNPEQGYPDALWKKIWRLNTPERVRTFIWIAAKGCLATNSVRKYRHLTEDGKCSLCNEVEETNLHCLRDCRIARTVWNRLIPSNRRPTFFIDDYDEWLRSNIRDDSEGAWTGDWGSFFSLVAWYLWKPRNEHIFQGKVMTTSTLFNYISIKGNEWAKTWTAASLQLDVTQKPHRAEELIGWKPPRAGWIKLNTDGAAQGNHGLISAGGALRDVNGDWIAGFCSKIGTGTAIEAELWGIYKGIDLAWNKEIKFLIIETDSQLALDLLNKRMNPTHPLATLLRAIRRLIAQEWVVQLVHTYREGNRVADWLSKHSLVYPFRTFELLNPPPELQKILLEDLRGISFLRQVVV
ncbi:unnamed protein product [Linum trigynum]|uniref:RNase H type-1 domain-containing protein n=1 Tax=Linum trigynum TaxID=586398 RepID=A0AAV2FQA9_9ROSI